MQLSLSVTVQKQVSLASSKCLISGPPPSLLLCLVVSVSSSLRGILCCEHWRGERGSCAVEDFTSRCYQHIWLTMAPPTFRIDPPPALTEKPDSKKVLYSVQGTNCSFNNLTWQSLSTTLNLLLYYLILNLTQNKIISGRFKSTRGLLEFLIVFLVSINCFAEISSLDNSVRGALREFW